MCAQSLSCTRLFLTPWTVAHQAPLPLGFLKQEYWSGLPFSTPGDLPTPGIEPASLASPALADGFFTTVPPGKPINLIEKSSVFPSKENTYVRDFPGGPVAKTPHSQCRRMRFSSR